MIELRYKDFDILTGNSADVLKTLPDGIVDTIVTSPPYFGLRNYGNKEEQIGIEESPHLYVNRLVEVFRECKRVLKDTGTLWLNLGDSYCNTNGYCRCDDSWKREGRNDAPANDRNLKALHDSNIKTKDLIGIPWMVAFALREDGWYLRSDIIWHKPNPMPSSVRDRCSSSHEYIFMLSKNAHYYFDYEAIEEPANYDWRKDCLNNGSQKYSDSLITAEGTEHCMDASAHQRWKFKVMPKFGGTKYPDSESGSDGTYSGRELEPKMKNIDESKGQSSHSMHMRIEKGLQDEVYAVRRKRDVWTVPTRGFDGAHFATYPENLIEPCILAGCPIGGVVLDPFNGSGTTGCVSLKNHRKYIGIELNTDYVQLAIKRITEENKQTDFLDVLDAN